MFRRILAAMSPAVAAFRRGGVALLGVVLMTSLATVIPASAAAPQAAAQVLNWTAGDDITHYRSAPTTAVAGAATIVFENSAATGNTTGMPHTLTFDTSAEGYNHDVNVNILANPFDANNGRHEQTVTLTPGKYRYFCAMPGHSSMVGELIVTDGGGADTTPPTVSADVTGQKDANGNFISKATVAVTASDAQSGVDTVEYQLDDTTFQPYTVPVAVTAIGDHSVQYRAKDKAGNVSPIGSVSFRVVEPAGDTTPPTVSAVVSGEKDVTGNYIAKATVTVTATDTQSGVKTIEYSLDGAAFTAYTAPVVVTALGAHMFHYRATDVAGNVSPEGMVGFTVVAPPVQDTTPPTVSAAVAGDKDANGNYITKATITVTATDTQSGVKTVEYSLDNGAFGPYTAPVVVTALGAHTLHYRATDVAGNVSPEGTTTFTVVTAPDTTPPTVSAVASGQRDSTGKYIGSATVTITASDTQSGVKAVEYSMDGGAFGPYTVPVVVTALGAHMVHYRATDVAGNVSPEGMISFTVIDAPVPDTKPPTVSAAVSGSRDAGGNYLGSATVTITATDTQSGVKTVEYAIGTGAWTAYTTPVKFTTKGAYTVRYRATDVAENTSTEQTVSFTVVDSGSDVCPDSDLRGTVIIGRDNTGIANVDTGNGCTINDLINEHAQYPNHGTFVRHVEEVTDVLVRNGVLSIREQGTIVRTASRSDIGK